MERNGPCGRGARSFSPPGQSTAPSFLSCRAWGWRVCCRLLGLRCSWICLEWATISRTTLLSVYHIPVCSGDGGNELVEAADV